MSDTDDALDGAVDTLVASINSFKADVIRRGGPDVCDASRTLVIDGVCHRAFQRYKPALEALRQFSCEGYSYSIRPPAELGDTEFKIILSA